MSRDGVFISRRGTGEGVFEPAPIVGVALALPNRSGDGKPSPYKVGDGLPTWIDYLIIRGFHTDPNGVD